MNQTASKVITQETIHSIVAPQQHYTMLLAADDNLISIDADGTLTATHNADDAAMWAPQGAGFRYVITHSFFPAS